MLEKNLNSLLKVFFSKKIIFLKIIIFKNIPDRPRTSDQEIRVPIQESNREGDKQPDSVQNSGILELSEKNL